MEECQCPSDSLASSLRTTGQIVNGIVDESLVVIVNEDMHESRQACSRVEPLRLLEYCRNRLCQTIEFI